MTHNGKGNGAARPVDTPAETPTPSYAVDGREPSVVQRPASLDDLVAALRAAHELVIAGIAVVVIGVVMITLGEAAH